MTNTIPEKKKWKTTKRLSEEVLEIAVKRKVKGKGKRKIYTQLNSEFQKEQRERRQPS